MGSGLAPLLATFAACTGTGKVEPDPVAPDAPALLDSDGASVPAVRVVGPEGDEGAGYAWLVWSEAWMGGG